MRACEICGKKSMIQKSGAHQYGGGWAMRATKKRRVWMVNLHTARVTYQGVRRTMRLCTKCLRRVKAASISPISRHSKSPIPVILSGFDKLTVNSAKDLKSVKSEESQSKQSPVALG